MPEAAVISNECERSFPIRNKISPCGRNDKKRDPHTADYELMLRFLVKHRITAAYLPEILIQMRSGGAGNVTLQARLRANRMDRKAWEVNGLKPYPWTLMMKPLRKVGQWFSKPEVL